MAAGLKHYISLHKNIIFTKIKKNGCVEEIIKDICYIIILSYIFHQTEKILLSHASYVNTKIIMLYSHL